MIEPTAGNVSGTRNTSDTEDTRSAPDAAADAVEDVALVTRIEQQGDALRVEACGEIDLFSVEIFTKALQDACAEAPREAESPQQCCQDVQNILVDLRQVKFIDSAGLSSLVDMRKDCQTACILTLVIEPKTQPGRVIRLSRFDSYFPVVDSLPAFDPPQA